MSDLPTLFTNAIARAAHEVECGSDLAAASELLTTALDEGDGAQPPMSRTELLLGSIAAGVIALARVVEAGVDCDDDE